MRDFEYKDYFNMKSCFIGDECKVSAILDSYVQNQIDLTDINRVFELYHIKLFFEKVSDVPSWTREYYEQYKNLTLDFKGLVIKYFEKINLHNIVEIYENCYVTYLDDFLDFFYRLKIYKRIPKDKITEVLRKMELNPFQILQDKEFVEYYNDELTALLQDPLYGERILVFYYLEENDTPSKIYFPKSLTHEIKLKILEEYLNGEFVNIHHLQLIINGKNSKELQIPAKYRKRAQERLDEFWNNPNKHFITQEFGASATFGKFEEEVTYKFENGILYSKYGVDWIKNNLDYPTLLNNFIYLFGYVDKQMRCRLTSKKSDRGILEDFFSLKGKGIYRVSMSFETFNALANAQMAGYVRELEKLDVDIEDVIKWFYEDYLVNEFSAKGFICNVPIASDSILSKCKALPSAFDGIVKQFKMYCEDGEIDRDLFQYITDSPRLKDIPSLVKNKYCYIADPDLDKEIYLVFSDQSMLGYTERTKSKYSTLYSLVSNEKITLSECPLFNRKALDWLMERNVIYTNDNVIQFNNERLYLLKEFYENEVISMQHVKSQMLKELIMQGTVATESTLLSRPEYQYFDYLLNNAEFGNGLALRNRYIHDTVSQNEDRQRQDYYTFLKVMIILIIKINDDFCLQDEIKRGGDYYEF